MDWSSGTGWLGRGGGEGGKWGWRGGGGFPSPVESGHRFGCACAVDSSVSCLRHSQKFVSVLRSSLGCGGESWSLLGGKCKHMSSKWWDLSAEEKWPRRSREVSFLQVSKHRGIHFHRRLSISSSFCCCCQLLFFLFFSFLFFFFWFFSVRCRSILNHR